MIGIAFDDVLAATHGPLLDACCRELGWCPDAGDLVTTLTGDWWERVPGAAAIRERPEWLASVPPRLDALRAMPAIVGLAEPVLVIVRRPQAPSSEQLATIRRWLDRYGIVSHRLIWTADVVAACQAAGCRFVIDAAPAVAIAACAAQITVFLVDAPYNAHVPEHPQLWRVSNLMAIPSLLRTRFDMGRGRR